MREMILQYTMLRRRKRTGSTAPSDAKREGTEDADGKTAQYEAATLYFIRKRSCGYSCFADNDGCETHK